MYPLHQRMEPINCRWEKSDANFFYNLSRTTIRENHVIITLQITAERETRLHNIRGRVLPLPPRRKEREVDIWDVGVLRLGHGEGKKEIN